MAFLSATIVVSRPVFRSPGHTVPAPTPNSFSAQASPTLSVSPPRRITSDPEIDVAPSIKIGDALPRPTAGRTRP
ncbi:hypothetical protein J2D73_11755 [Acetobacter sacchari]|uniref:Uncharacterized protein n=1 Tax=Acetobacter sacchari TaxID=2661687 RepID=A0ABS3LX25_9PROT|nr:hypothetical protein [Acetobacter sacchari]